MVAAMYSGYQPLDLTRRQIRLLNVKKSHREPLIHATLQTISLDEFCRTKYPKYCALSWCWGVTGRSKSIVLDRQEVHIRETLHSCLLALTEHFEDLVIWVDAIAINQNDDAEKSSQVMMMGDVYRNAERVYAWLGDGDASSDLVFECSKKLNSTNPGREPLSEKRKEQYECFELIFLKPYWARVWTLQERALASELWVMCGEKLAPWKEIDKKYQELQKKTTSKVFPDLYYTENHFQQQRYRSSRFNKKKPIVDLMIDHGTLSCTDIRDKVYGLRELATDGERVTVNYQKSALEVFFDVLLLENTLRTPSRQYGVLADGMRLLPYFPFTEDDLSAIKGSRYKKFASLDNFLQGREDKLCHWIAGREVGDRIDSYRRNAGNDVPNSHQRLFDFVGFSEQYDLSGFCLSPKVRPGDLVCALHWHEQLAQVAAVYRESSEQPKRLQFVQLVFQTKSFIDDPNDSRPLEPHEKLKIRGQFLELLWSKGHIYVCSLTQTPIEMTQSTLDPLHRSYGIRIHLSRLAVLVLLTFRMLTNIDIPDFIERALRISEINRDPSCRCSGTMSLQPTSQDMKGTWLDSW